jgi:hypothetical protein
MSFRLYRFCGINENDAEIDEDLEKDGINVWRRNMLDEKEVVCRNTPHDNLETA